MTEVMCWGGRYVRAIFLSVILRVSEGFEHFL